MEDDELFDRWEPLGLDEWEEEEEEEEILGFLAGDWAVDAELLGFLGF